MSNTASATSVIEYSSPAYGKGGTWSQTVALLIDAYRDLQARKLFWLTLILSLLVAVMFAFVGINNQGITIFGKLFPGAWNTTLIPPAQFYKFLFTTLAIPFWLGFMAAILGLIAVGGTFPDMISSGSIDLYLSRPIGRFRLFLTKYLFGLIFTACQVFLFSFASFMIIGIRGGAWEPRIFLAVPLVTAFFSYLYCICVLIGIVTRSTLAAILLTLLCWGGLWAIHNTDMILTTFTTAAEQRVATQNRLIKTNEDLIAKNAALPEDKQSNVSQFQFQLDKQKQQLPEFEQTASQLRSWQKLILWVETPLPKTSETVALMSRWLVDSAPFQQAEQEEHQDRRQRMAQRRAERGEPNRPPSDSVGSFTQAPEAQQRLVEELNARTFGWVVGTSLGFETVILALAGWVFCRRDY